MWPTFSGIIIVYVCIIIIMCVYALIAFGCEHNEFVNQVDGRYALAVHFSLDWSVCLATGSRIIVGIPSGLMARKKQQQWACR